MFIDGKKMLAGLKKALPLKEEHSERILNQFNDIIYATIYGAIIIAIIQGTLAGIGYFALGIDSAFFLALLTITAAFIPFIGSTIVWVPIAAITIINGLMTDNNTLFLKGIGFLFYGILVISTIDNVIRPKLVGDRANVHPLIILLGVFGGLSFFGVIGIIIGPLLLTLFIASLKIYEAEKNTIL